MYIVPRIDNVFRQLTARRDFVPHQIETTYEKVAAAADCNDPCSDGVSRPRDREMLGDGEREREREREREGEGEGEREMKRERGTSL